MVLVPQIAGDLDSRDDLRNAALESYIDTIWNIGHYAIEFDNGITEHHRNYLNAVAAEARAGTPKAFRETCRSLRALMRDYRDKASAYLDQLRTELTDTANALQRILDAFSQAEDDPQNPLERALRTVKQLPRGAAAEAIAPGLGSAAETLEASLGQITQQHQVTVSEFLIEISLLHKRIDRLESAISVAALTKLFTRAEIELRIRSAESSAWLLLLRVEGFRQAEHQFSQDVAQELAAALIKRLRNNTVPDAIIGRWSEEEVIVILPVSAEEAETSARWVREHLSGPYACLQAGKIVRPAARVDISVVELTPGQPEATLERISKFFRA